MSDEISSFKPAGGLLQGIVDGIPEEGRLAETRQIAPAKRVAPSASIASGIKTQEFIIQLGAKLSEIFGDASGIRIDVLPQQGQIAVFRTLPDREQHEFAETGMNGGPLLMEIRVTEAGKGKVKLLPQFTEDAGHDDMPMDEQGFIVDKVDECVEPLRQKIRMVVL